MSDAGSARPVTVVVPVFGDLPSLAACVESLQHSVDQAVHRVLLVNDCGPDANEIEAALLEMIAHSPGFFYARNPKNLGFVGNCNRAALELDTTENDILLLNSDTVVTPGFIEELSAVLHSSPQHGAVCPRSNNATIASLPFTLRVPSRGRNPDRTSDVHAALRDVLPRFSIAPVAIGFCILIRRDLIREYGLFDEAFAPGYGEENDFCLRIGEHGYLSLIAHRALVFHLGARSFVGARREALRSAHEKIVVSRYPGYTGAVRAYVNQGRDPVDVFADAMVPGDTAVRILIDLEQPGSRLDTWGEQLLSDANALTLADIHITVSVPDRLAAAVGRRHPNLTVVRQSRLNGQWDVALARTDGVRLSQLLRLNRTSLRWVFVGSSFREHLAFADAVLAEAHGTRLLRDVVTRWGRSNVDVERLRARWKKFTTTPGYLSGVIEPMEPLHIRALRRGELLAPRPVGWAKGIARGVIKGH
jgi:GT2 family glycosyltransferase